MLSRRPFTIGDSMALVAATALGLALDRWRTTELVLSSDGATGVSIGASHWLHVLNNGHPSCFVVTLALVLIPLRWMRPHSSERRLIRQPGAVACLAIIGTIAVNIAILLLGGAINAWTHRPDSPRTVYSNWYYWDQAVRWVPKGVIGAWAALALGGRWSPEKSWIDRLGTALGLYWIAIYLLGFFSKIISVWLPYK